MDDQTATNTKRIWTYGLVLVSIVSLAIVAIGLLLPRSEPELTTAPTTSSEEPGTAASEQPEIVDEPVDLDAPIPGCDVVEVPEMSGYSAISVISRTEPEYDNPRFP